MITELLYHYISNANNLLFLAISWSAAVYAFSKWKQTGKVFLIYAHIALLLAPLIDLGTSIQCSMGFSTAITNLCSDYIAKVSLLTLPFVVILTIISGFFVIPIMFTKKYKAKRIELPIIRKCAKKAGIKTPEVYAFDSQQPTAFTVHKRIFTSVGLFDLLTKKEQEAVFLHEIGHIVSGSNWRKFSTFILRIFSPLAAFAPCQITKEEKTADEFAAKIQKTSRYLNGAKRKIKEYYR